MVKKHWKSTLTQSAVLWVVLTMVLGMLGVAAAAWQDGIEVQGVVSTGEIDPVYTNVNRVSRGEAYIINNGKGIAIYVADAQPHEQLKFEYTLTHRGSVPVEFDTLLHQNDPGIKVINTLARGIIGGNGDSVAGEILVQVEDVEELSVYGFYLELLFQQWNIAP